MTPDETGEYLERITATLSEQFTSVQIVVTRLRHDGSTEWYGSGSGDWYARKAACEEFVERDQARTVAASIKQVNDQD